MLNLDSPKYYINREWSWLEFNKRVLYEACEKNNPLLERMKFLSIVTSNLEEFFMVRVAGLKKQSEADFVGNSIDMKSPAEQLKGIRKRVQKMLKKQYEILKEELIPKLEEKGIEIITSVEKLETYKDYLSAIFNDELLPVLTPISIGSTHPFPNLITGKLYLAVELSPIEEAYNFIEKANISFIQIPSNIKGRFIKIEDSSKYIPVENIIKLFVERIYNGYTVLSANIIKITRDADFTIAEEDASDLLKEIETTIKKMHTRSVIKLEYEENLAQHILKFLAERNYLNKENLYSIKGLLNLDDLFELYLNIDRADLKYEQSIPIPNYDFEEKDIFKIISKKDYIFFHPYHSYDPVVELINTAADDANVLAIKQLLYRTSSNSQIISALIRAAEKGKHISIVVELKARFDEKRNIEWAKKLEDAGAHVIYGIAGLKTHAKALMIVRKEDNEIKRYIHLATGNYNEITARLYTDFSFFTSESRFGEDISTLFNLLTGLSFPKNWNYISLAPIDLRKKFISLIEREIENAKHGIKSKIIAKMNSLCDKEIVQTLYKASIAGVKIDLIVRGICVLRPELVKISKNIKVKSIIGKYLEHARIYYFYNGGAEELYLASADWMERNLDKRIELLYPIIDKKNKNFIKKILKLQLDDKKNSWSLKSNGNYKNFKKGVKKKDCFKSIYSFIKKLETKKSKKVKKEFQVLKSPE